MALDKFYNIYGLDTSAFYFDDEMELSRRLDKAKRIKNKCKKRQGIRLAASGDDNHVELSRKQKRTLKRINRIIRDTKAELKCLLASRVNTERAARPESFVPTNIISTFDSDLTRCFELKTDVVNEEIIVVQVYFFDVAYGLVTNGFTYGGHKYCYFSSSAGQIRTKKMVFVREDILARVWNRLTCGLTVERINELGGVNPNKYLAYLALCNSATDEWKEFNIDKVIVVEDMETVVHGTVDFIDDKDYSITRQDTDLTLTQTDGVGMARKDVIKSNRMFRAPWMKGLLARFAFDDLIREKGWSPIVKDIYGKEHDVLAEDIEIILTKSQFKMWSYFDSWEQYKENFKKYGCSAGYCKVEEERIPFAKINYQMLQTLTDISDRELYKIAERSINTLNNISSNKYTMLKTFGIVPQNANMSTFQKCLKLYPELLADPYTRETLRKVKRSMEYEVWSGKLEIFGKYTFIVPDMYAFCEYMFGGITEPKGLLADGEVYCSLFPNSPKLDCLRSPHLYKEHAVRNNVAVEGKDTECAKWFDSKALYISTHDFISRILQCDFDGDTSLVVADKTLISVAERNMEGVVPLFYNMAKAPKCEINKEVLYNGLIAAFTGGNIGTYSNSISKIWNSGKVTDEAVKAVKWLCMDNNFIIDYAKTLYKPQAPDDVKSIIKKYTDKKLPHFFIYAKEKEEGQVEAINRSCVNRLRTMIPRKSLKFRFDGMSEFDYRTLMNDPDIRIDTRVTRKFNLLGREFKMQYCVDSSNSNESYISNYIRNEMLNTGYSEIEITDMLVKELFGVRKTKRKGIFWSCYGDAVLANIQKNIDSRFTTCNYCGGRFYKQRKEEMVCPNCKNRCLDKPKTKTLVCIDCGTSFEVKRSNKKTTRCSECRHKKILLYDRTRKAKFRL